MVLHLVVEHLGFARFSFGNQVLGQDVENILADTLELSLNLLPVGVDDLDMLV